LNVHGGDVFGLAFVLLLAAVVAVPVAKRLGLGSVLGYLVAGVIVGPWVLGLVGEEGEDILHFAEFGVVLMLFLIGLELQPAKLWRLRRSIFGLGGLQVLLTTLLLLAVGLLLGWSWRPALAASLALSLSSTAIVLQTMQEKGWLPTNAGQSGFSVLLFQDVAVIPILAALPLLADPELAGRLAAEAGGHAAAAADAAGHAGETAAGASHAGDHGGGHATGPLEGLAPGLQTAAVLGAMALVVALGRYVVSPVLRVIARTRLPELSLAAALVLVIGIALLMARVGLSPALGTFVAGVVLAGSPYRHELEANIEPFKGLLLGVFFIAVGSSLNLGLVIDHPADVVLGVVVLVAIKLVVLAVLGHAFGLRRDQNLLFTLALAQGGEFAFVLLSFAVQQGAVPAAPAGALVVTVTLSMALTPLLLLLYEKVLQPRVGTCREPRREADAPEPGEVIVVGFGHFGSTLGRLLRTGGIEPTVLENDSDRVEVLRQLGLPVYYGDATRADLLRAAGAEHARLLILALDDPQAQLRIVRLAREHFPQAELVARARGWTDAHELLAAGVEHVFRENLDSALRAGAESLRLLGARGHQAHRLARRFRRRDEELLRELLAHREDEGQFLNEARERIHDLEQLMRAEQDGTAEDTGWDVSRLRRPDGGER
jgi:Kef-type K+ transport system membrane component KefB/voltage-gated potassium channel Kch